MGIGVALITTPNLSRIARMPMPRVNDDDEFEKRRKRREDKERREAERLASGFALLRDEDNYEESDSNESED
jgi:hypothetical protein